MKKAPEPTHQPEIPPSLDQFGSQRKIIPAEVKGKFRKYRDYTQFILIVFFIVTPWLKIKNEQAILFNIAERKFNFFGLNLHSYDAPLVFFIFAITLFSLIFVTAVWGRAFCGWACPQTVFIDGVFRRIEIIVEGKYLKRRRDAASPMTLNKFIRKTIKWLLFIFVSSVIAHSFMAFFVGADNLIKMMTLYPRDNWTYFSLINLISLAILFNFAYFREQFCLIVCPYGRFQSVLLDKLSMNVAYDVKRGEPRKGLAAIGQSTGDCVSCNRCVEVCPTGIDIRQGLQMECIACTACIDACDEIMVKVKKPTGLISYANSLGQRSWTLKSPRALFSLGIVIICTSALIFSLSSRGDIDLSVLRAKDDLFQEVGLVDGKKILSNHFKLHITNQSRKDLKINISSRMKDLELTTITLENPLTMKAGADKEIHIFVRFPQNLLAQGQGEAKVYLIESGTTEVLKADSVHLLGPSIP